MGCVSGVNCYDDERPVHQVTIPRPFAVSKHEVTYAQWDACAAAKGCLDDQGEGRRQRRNSYWPDDNDWGRGSRPVNEVSWLDAQNYVRWLSQQTGATYRLLTEAEWEYAARAGTETAYSWGNELVHGRANCDTNVQRVHRNGDCGRVLGEVGRAKRYPSGPITSGWSAVGSYPPNPWGLYDTHGNAEEWVQDCWNDNHNGAPSDGSARDVRGNCKCPIRGNRKRHSRRLAVGGLSLDAGGFANSHGATLRCTDGRRGCC